MFGGIYPRYGQSCSSSDNGRGFGPHEILVRAPRQCRTNQSSHVTRYGAFLIHWFGPTRRTNSWKPGSERSGSKRGSYLRYTSHPDLSSKAFSNHRKVLLLSPLPE